jgi:acetyl-CoA synthetase
LNVVICSSPVASSAGTELGGSYLSGTMLQPQAPTYFSMPSLGSALVLLSSDGRQSPHLTDAATPFTGEVALAPPMLGSSQRLLNHDHHQLYFQVAATPSHDRNNCLI